MDWDDALDAMHAWAVGGSGLDAQHVAWGDQDVARPEAPAVILRISNISPLGEAWVDYEDNPHVFDDVVVTANVGTDELSAVAHGRLTGDGPVRLTSTGAFPTGTDGDTDYWVVKTSDDALKLAASFQDAVATVPVVVDLQGAGSGTIALVDTPATLRRGEEIAARSRMMIRVTLELRCHAEPVVGNMMAVFILQRVHARSQLPSQQAILEAANIAFQDCERVRSLVTGKRDDALFEPRALLDVHVNVAVEESEYLTIIERVLLTDEIPEPNIEFTIP